MTSAARGTKRRHFRFEADPKPHGGMPPVPANPDDEKGKQKAPKHPAE